MVGWANKMQLCIPRQKIPQCSLTLTLQLQAHVLKSNGGTEQRLFLGLEVADLSQQSPSLLVHPVLRRIKDRCVLEI